MLFKVLTAEGLPAHGGSGEYPLPSGAKKGAWTKAVFPVACKSGYHLTTTPEKWWVKGARLFRAEYKGLFSISLPDKVAYQSVRLIEEITLGHPLIRLYPVWRAWMGEENLSRANLSGAYLSGANLAGANLSGADLSGAYLFGAIGYHATY